MRLVPIGGVGNKLTAIEVATPPPFKCNHYMTAIEIPIDLKLPKSLTPRSEGIHVSAIIRCIATEQGILKPEWAEDLSLSDVREITDPVAVLRINIGLAWEAHYIPLVGNIVDHPGEMQLDGIFLTHDGESVDVIITQNRERSPIVHFVDEVKATYKSTKTVGDLSTQWMWMAQCKAYCKALGTRFARMHVLFLCGDYSYPIKPMLKVWQVEFTQEEVDMNWDLLRDYRDYRLGKESA